MKPKGYIDTEARVKEMFANRARVKAKQEWATIMEKVDIEMRRRRYCNPGIQCHVSGTMEHCDNPSTLTPQGGSSLCSTGDVRSQATSARIIKVVDKAEEPDKDSGVEEEDIKLSTAAMVPKAHRFARSELGVTPASRCVASRKIYDLLSASNG